MKPVLKPFLKSLSLLAFCVACSESEDAPPVSTPQEITFKTVPLSFSTDDLKDVKYAGYSEIGITIHLSQPAPPEGLSIALSTQSLESGASVSYFDCGYKNGVKGDFSTALESTKVEAGETSKTTCAVVKTKKDLSEIVLSGTASGWQSKPASPIKVIATKIVLENVYSTLARRPGSCIALAALHTVLGNPSNTAGAEFSSFRSALSRPMQVLDGTGKPLTLWNNDRCTSALTEAPVFPGEEAEGRKILFVKAPDTGTLTIELGAENQDASQNSRLTFTVDPSAGF